MPEQNFSNRVLYHGDNLEFLRGMNSDCIDLIATDPPFNTGRNRAGSAGRYEDNWRWLEEGAPKPDQWSWENVVHTRWLQEIRADNAALYEVIEATRKAHSDGAAAFLCFLGVRLLEMRRILKSTGSIYLHCDHTANAYIRMTMDAIFGRQNFIADVIWNYGTPSGGRTAGKRPVKAYDTILSYAKEYGKHTYNREFLPYSDKYIQERFVYSDDDGRRYRTRRRASGMTRQYLDESPGMPLSNVWTDIKQLYAYHLVKRKQEETGSPDQKPLALYERIIKVASSAGDWVLDPFCGCATTPIAAEHLGRQWVGIDRRSDAEAHIINRLLTTNANQGKFIPIKDGVIRDASKLAEARALVKGMNFTFTTEIPERTDEGKNAPPLAIVHGAPERRRNPYNYDQMKSILIELFGYQCWGCDFVPPENIKQPRERFLELDHIIPKSEGGGPEIQNRALLCRPCNGDKKDTHNLTWLRQQAGYATGRRKGARHPIELPLARMKVEQYLARQPQPGALPVGA